MIVVGLIDGVIGLGIIHHTLDAQAGGGFVQLLPCQCADIHASVKNPDRFEYAVGIVTDFLQRDGLFRAGFIQNRDGYRLAARACCQQSAVEELVVDIRIIAENLNILVFVQPQQQMLVCRGVAACLIRYSTVPFRDNRTVFDALRVQGIIHIDRRKAPVRQAHDGKPVVIPKHRS